MMDIKEAECTAKALLNQSSGRATPARINVLSMLLSAPAALNHQAIEHIARERALSFDRVTLYRALEWLVEQGLAHRIASVNRSWYFNALSRNNTPSHAHFHCTQCAQIYCLEDVQAMPLGNLPKDYQLEEAELGLQGHCMSCTQKDH